MLHQVPNKKEKGLNQVILAEKMILVRNLKIHMKMKEIKIHPVVIQWMTDLINISFRKQEKVKVKLLNNTMHNMVHQDQMTCLLDLRAL